MNDRQARAALGVSAPRFRLKDWARESALSVLRHPVRSLLAALGTVLGSAAFVATVGITSTVSHQVSDAFDVRRATEVRIVPDNAEMPDGWHAPDRLDRLRHLNGVTAAGRRVLPIEISASRTVEAIDRPMKIMGADPGALAAIEPHLVLGRTFDQFHEEHRLPVILLAQPIARELGITRTGVAVFLGDRAFTVIGIFDDVRRRPEALLGGIVPASVAETMVAPDSHPQNDVLIATAPGAAQLIAAQARAALWPEAPTVLRSIAPPDPRTLRREVEGNVAESTLLLSLVALIIGAVSIANAEMASMSARVQEIGLRRAIGARPAHIFAQLLGETTALGGLGGAAGVLIGVAVTAMICLANRWTPVLDLRTTLISVLASCAVGLIAGLWPAARATRIEPITALQR